MAAEGLITLRSDHGPKDTMNRLEAEVTPLLSEPGRLESMARAARTLAFPDAADRVAEEVPVSLVYRKPLPFAPRGATGVSHATLVELALAGAKAG
jgi:hypothetical protein